MAPSNGRAIGVPSLKPVPIVVGAPAEQIGFW
jgi:hypothetical protein